MSHHFIPKCFRMHIENIKLFFFKKWQQCHNHTSENVNDKSLILWNIWCWGWALYYSRLNPCVRHTHPVQESLELCAASATAPGSHGSTREAAGDGPSICIPATYTGHLRDKPESRPHLRIALLWTGRYTMPLAPLILVLPLSLFYSTIDICT